ncbi:MAG: hydrogenase formation protein HypD [Nitrospiraceae bacterium]|nr:hydrogenase formation protein HypD [Nitrospiraceae bacterium]
MKFVDEYRDGAYADRYAKAIAEAVTQPWSLMEVCGGQTHAIVRFGIDQLLPDSINLIHGPGCPVCVTAIELIDKAIDIAAQPEVILCSFGDMVRVPGSTADLQVAKANGGDVRIVYSPLDALKLAREHPERQVVFFAVGFETTAPVNATALLQARQQGIENFSMLVAHVRIPPAIEAILGAPDRRVQALIAPGHVCTVMGDDEYAALAAKYHVPIVITGFEPLDILRGIHMSILQLEAGAAEVQNEYKRSARDAGNPVARRMVDEVFDITTRKWRGIGAIPDGGLCLKEAFASFDAERRFGLVDYSVEESTECMSGQVLQGIIKPHECPAFGGRCTPEHPLGATMVSSEGACAAYYRYRRAAGTGD